MARRRQQQEVPTSPDDVLAFLAAQVPGASIKKAGDSSSAYIVRRPTGIWTLDVATGGGFPAGGVSELLGGDNTGKNFMCNLLMRQNQRIHGDQSSIGVAAIEYQFDKVFARECGVEVELSDQELYNMEIPEEDWPNYKSQVGTIHTIRGLAEHVLDQIIEMVKLDFYDIIIVDSIGGLLVKQEEEKGMADGGMTGTMLPRVLAEWLRKLNGAWCHEPHGRPNLTSVIVTNQVTAKIGGFTRPGMPPPTQGKGGYALRHGKLLSLELKKGQVIKVSNRKIGHSIRWKVAKGKAGCADGASGEFNYYQGKEGYALGPDYEESSFRALLDAGLINRRGSTFDVPSLEMSARGRDVLFRKLKEHDPEWFFSDQLYRELLTAHEIQACNRWSEIED